MTTFNNINDFIADAQDYNCFQITSNKEGSQIPNYMTAKAIKSEYGTLIVSRTLTYQQTYPTAFISAQKTIINDKVIYLIALDKDWLLTIQASKKQTNDKVCLINDFDWNTFMHEEYFDIERSHFKPISKSYFIVVDMYKFPKLSSIQEQKIISLLETTTKLYIRDIAKTVYFKIDKCGNIEVGVYDLDQERFLRGKEINIEDCKSITLNNFIKTI